MTVYENSIITVADRARFLGCASPYRFGHHSGAARNQLEIGPYLEHPRNMKTVLQLTALTRLEKLRAMEELWQDLSRPAEQYKSPQWHGEVLRAREASLKAGEDAFVPWEKAKKMLRERKK